MLYKDDATDRHPIDVVESFVERCDWDFDRVNDDQIAMAIEGQWRTYSVTLTWSSCDDTLRMVLAFEMKPPEDRLPVLYEMLNLVNENFLVGAFTWWTEQQLMVFRYGLVADERGVSAEQVESLLETAVGTAEQYYPAFQLAIWSDKTPEEAIGIAIAEAYGRA